MAFPQGLLKTNNVVLIINEAKRSYRHTGLRTAWLISRPKCIWSLRCQTSEALAVAPLTRDHGLSLDISDHVTTYDCVSDYGMQNQFWFWVASLTSAILWLEANKIAL